ncbi:unnamed protein product [Vicia faba]|uniref:Uncharacterized protein n=1 Tax=Vicia faba TaxID=3906 RepID=A0AAV1AJF3_VICFA|nr:unnamed protein product [Vicia faba]
MRSLIFSKGIPAFYSSRYQIHHQSSSLVEVPKLALAAEYFFKMGVEGKRFRPTVASLLHDDVLDDAVTRRGRGSLNFVMGNKLAVLVGDFFAFPDLCHSGLFKEHRGTVNR